MKRSDIACWRCSRRIICRLGTTSSVLGIMARAVAELGVRNVFHPIARLLNPARATSQVIGLTHPPYFEKTAEALRMLGSPRALVVRGVEGDPELSIAMITKMLELRDERITPLTLAPKDAGLALGTSREMAGFPPDQREKEADLLRRILHGQVQGGPRGWVLLNAAMLLYAAGKESSLATCMLLARRAIDDGTAVRKLEELSQQPVITGPGGRPF